jgi:hypothetical protein
MTLAIDVIVAIASIIPFSVPLNVGNSISNKSRTSVRIKFDFNKTKKKFFF